MDERPPSRFSLRRPVLVTVIAGALVVLGTFLPWVDTPLFTTLGVSIPISFAALPIGLLVAGLGLLLVIAAFERTKGTEGGFSLAISALVVAGLVYTWLNLHQVTASASVPGLRGVGIGMWVCAIGAALGLAGSRLE